MRADVLSAGGMLDKAGVLSRDKTRVTVFGDQGRFARVRPE